MEVEIITYDDWIDESGRIQENFEHVPELKLFSFWQSLRSGTEITLPRLATEEAADVSLILKGAWVVDRNDVRRRLKQWVLRSCAVKRLFLCRRVRHVPHQAGSFCVTYWREYVIIAFPLRE